MNNVVKLEKGPTYYEIEVGSIHDEVEHCAEFFNLDPQDAHEYADKIIIAAKQMYGMDGVFAVPSITSISGVKTENVVALWDEYHLACIRMKMILTEKLSMKNLIQKDECGKPRIWKLESDAVRARWRADDKQHGQKIILISAQLGKEYVECSYSTSSLKMFSNERGEFPLDFCSFGAILLLHPERMENENSLIADMFGTKIVVKNKFGTKSDRIPLLQKFRGKLTLTTYPTDEHSYRSGIPSGIIL